jgi:MFS superfamily sulfate permease-like transporter
VVLGILKAGILGDLLPASVISGMLAAIGITIMMNQIPNAVGYNKTLFWEQSMIKINNVNFIGIVLNRVSLEAVIIALVCLTVLIGWNHKKVRKPHFLKNMPASLLAIGAGILVNIVFQAFFPKQALSDMHFVKVPVIDSMSGFISNFSFPDFNYLWHPGVWTAALSMAIIASIQAILGIEGVDKLDPQKRTTPLNRELMAQGLGNIVSGMIGGILLTSVIVRSLANVNAGARTRASAISQSLFLLIFVLALPGLLNQIPLAALATVLVYVGFQLVKPAVFLQSYKKGWAHLIPFLATIICILWTELLTGVCAGLIVAVIFILRDTLQPLFSAVQEGNQLTIRFEKNLSFVQKYELSQLLKKIPANSTLTLDISKINFIDEDIVDIIQRFMRRAPQRHIQVHIEAGENQSAAHLAIPAFEFT